LLPNIILIRKFGNNIKFHSTTLSMFSGVFIISA